MGNMTFKVNLLPNSTSKEYSLGSSIDRIGGIILWQI